MELAEDSLQDATRGPGWRRWAMRGVVAVLVIALVAAAVLWLKTLSGAAGPKRQVAKIALLPDKPPPPPPPKEEKRPEPKPEEKQAVQPKEAKPVEAPKPANEPIKMEGPAGEGASPFQAGAVNKDYAGGAPVIGGAAASGAGGIDRAQERFYANTARQLLQAAIERNLRGEGADMAAVFSLWLGADGAIQRFELAASGDARNDGALRAALDETSRSLKLPPPPPVAQPMRFRLTVRPLG